MVVTNEKKAAKLEANRARRNAKYEVAMNEGWRRVRKQEETYFIPPVSIEQPFAVSTIRSETTTRFQIWTKFITESLLQGILHTLAYYNEASGLLLVHCYDRDDRVGRKYVLCNAHVHKMKKPPKAQISSISRLQSAVCRG